MLHPPASIGDSREAQKPGPRDIPGLLSRRQMLQSMIVGAGGIATSDLLAQEPLPPPLTIEEHRNLQAAWNKINNHPYAKVEALEKPDPRTPTVYIGLNWKGETNDKIMRPIPHAQMAISSMSYLHESGWIRRSIESRKGNLENFSWPYSGSAFVIRSKVGPLVISNTHVLKYAQNDEVLAMTHEDDTDVAVAHLDSFNRFPEDEHDLPLTTLSGELPGGIEGRMIRSQGLGARNYSITGRALQVPICSTGTQICDDCTRYFALKISTKDVPDWRGLVGMSGDPGIGRSGRLADGIFHTAIRPMDQFQMANNQDYFLMWFSNNAHIQRVVAAAEKEYLRRKSVK